MNPEPAKLMAGYTLTMDKLHALDADLQDDTDPSIRRGTILAFRDYARRNDYLDEDLHEVYLNAAIDDKEVGVLE